MIDFNAVADEDLYGMCKGGDEDAWQYVYNYILTICKWNKWDLYDEPGELAQVITMHLIEKAIKKVNEKKKFRNFLKVMAINKIKDSFKSLKTHISFDEPRKNRKGDEFVPEYRDPAPLHDSVLVNLETMSIINAALKKLSETCQQIVTEYLNFKLGIYKDYKELSKVLKMPVPTISSSVRRCLNKLVEFKEIKALKC
jgi:RNA polymerase sigma factor (sigma-70 family)